MNYIKTMIIDDERLAREDLKNLTSRWEQIQIVAEAENAFTAKKLIKLKQPDLLFLDIQMPEKTGFELLEGLDYSPIVIFVTAFDRYAIKAFDVSALDYLVKPVHPKRFENCIQKVITQINYQQQEKNGAQEQFFIKDGNNCYFIKVSEIFYIKSIGNYAQIYFKDKTPLIKRSLNHLEEILPDYFFRCNRSEIINFNFIKQIKPTVKGILKITLTNHQIVDLSERKSVAFKELNKL